MKLPPVGAVPVHAKHDPVGGQYDAEPEHIPLPPVQVCHSPAYPHDDGQDDGVQEPVGAATQVDPFHTVRPTCEPVPQQPGPLTTLRVAAAEALPFTDVHV